MADIKLSIVNQALTSAGEEKLTSLTPGSPLAEAAIENYDTIVEEELENGQWKFATVPGYVPTLLTATVDKPLKYQYQLPANLLALTAVKNRSTVLDGEYFEQSGRIFRTAYNANISIDYIFRPDESVWPARFRRIIIQRLEALFLRVTERHSEAAGRDQSTDIKTMVAKHTEARQSRNRPLGDGTIAQARMGGRRRRFS